MKVATFTQLLSSPTPLTSSASGCSSALAGVSNTCLSPDTPVCQLHLSACFTWMSACRYTFSNHHGLGFGETLLRQWEVSQSWSHWNKIQLKYMFFSVWRWRRSRDNLTGGCLLIYRCWFGKRAGVYTDYIYQGPMILVLLVGSQPVHFKYSHFMEDCVTNITRLYQLSSDKLCLPV